MVRVRAWVSIGLIALAGSAASADPAPIKVATSAQTQAEAPAAGLAALPADRRERLQRKIAKLQHPEPQGYPDLAEAFYVNSRTGPVITRGDERTTEVRSIGPDMYRDAMRHIRSMPRRTSATGAEQPSLGTGPSDLFAATPGNALGVWSNLGPNNQGGRTRSILIDPGNPNTMYAGGVAGGVWKSTDGGANWAALTDQMANIAITTLAFNPSNTSTIYAGTGEGFGNIDAVRGAGIFRTTDAGQTWSQLASTNNSNFHFVNKILVSPRNTQRIYAATTTGLYRSIDGGTSFSLVLNTTAVGGCTDMAMQVGGASGRVFVSCGRFNSQGTVYRGDDADASTFVSALSLTGQSRSSIAVAPSNESVIYVMASQGTSGGGAGQYGLHGIYRSTDNGDSFTTRLNGLITATTAAQKIQVSLLTNPVFAVLNDCGLGTSSFNNQGWYDNVIAVDPLDSNRVWTGGIDLWRSDDGGATFGVASYWWFNKTDVNYAHADQHAIVFHPLYNGTSNATMFVGNDGGVQRTTNARGGVGTALAAVCGTPVASPVTWTDRSNGLVTTQFYDGSVYPDGLTYFGGLQDNGTLRATLGNTNWSVLAGGDGGYTAVDVNGAGTADDVLFLENTSNSLKRSTNGGASFSNANTGITGTGFLFIAPFTMAQANPDQLWIGGYDIWRTTNQATSWARATGNNGTCGTGSISAIAVHPTDGNRVLVGMSDGCYHYNTAALTAPNTGLWPGGGTIANGYISWMAWDPTNTSIAYAAISAFGINNFFKSIDGGVTWSASVGSGPTALPQIPLLSIAVNPNFPQQIFVGTDLGVFTSIDGGASWYVENTGFAKTPVESLKFNQAGTFLYAFTHGRGAWRTPVCNNCSLVTIGGTVSGLLPGNSVTLRNNGVDSLTVSANGVFVFAEPLQNPSAYAVTVQTQPSAPVQSCAVSSGSGTTSGSNVTNVTVACTGGTYTVGGTVSGLAPGNSVVLQNNGGDDLTVSANGVFTFATPVIDGTTYAVTVLTQPTTPNQTCLVSNGSGSSTAVNITSVSVVCTTIAYTVGGSVSGLAVGNSVVLQNNAGDNLTVNADGSFTFATAISDGGTYAVTVLTQPTTPNQTCVVSSGGGTINGANVTGVNVTCTTNTYTVGGTLSGLSVGNTLVLQNNGGDDLSLTSNGAFAFPTAITDGGSYLVTILAQPSSPSQICVVSNGTGSVSGGPVTSVSVSCASNAFTIGGTVTGLAVGNSVTLQNNGADNLIVSSDGSFTFANTVSNGGSYSVSVLTQPTTPNQTCVVSSGSGTVSGAAISNVSVVCSTNTYTVGGAVSGLAAGNSVVLQNNAGNDLTVGANGAFTFSSSLADGSAYAVTVQTQPTTPNQTCVVSSGSGTLTGANVTNVSVACTTNTYTIGGSVSGLAPGNGVVLQNNGGNNTNVVGNGGFSFTTALADGATYAVTVLTQPTTPSQTCVVTNGSGTVTGANVTTVQVACTTNVYTIGGTVSGLATGNSVVLRNNGGDDLIASANGSFTFATALADGGSYNVTVLTQPTTPNQTCVVSNGSGSLNGANVTNVGVVCTTNTYTIGGTVSGLASGNSVVLQNNGGNDATVSADGPFTFSTALSDGSAYVVTVLTQPTTPNQTCVVSNGSGALAGANVTNVVVVCTTNTYTVGGTVSGLAAGNSVVLQNNGGGDTTVSADGTFAFATALADGSGFNVTVLTQPTTPNQTCVVSNGAGSLNGANVTNVSVVCTTNTYTIGGTVSGLAAGNSVVLQNNGGNDLTVNANGVFDFSSALLDGSGYAVTVLTQPTTPNQTCLVANAIGTLTGANVSNVSVLCTTNTYTIGGTISGLASGNDVVLQNNSGNDLVVSANGSFVFGAALADGSSYTVAVLTQPTSPNQTCVISDGAGSLTGANVTSINIQCTTNSYAIGGTLSGLAAGASVTLQNNAGDDLVLNANGPFNFAAPLLDGSSYTVTVLTQPAAPFQQVCLVSQGVGVLAGADANGVVVNCVATGIFSDSFE